MAGSTIFAAGIVAAAGTRNTYRTINALGFVTRWIPEPTAGPDASNPSSTLTFENELPDQFGPALVA